MAAPIGMEESRAYGRRDAVDKGNAYASDARARNAAEACGTSAGSFQFRSFKIGFHFIVRFLSSCNCSSRGTEFSVRQADTGERRI
jgi:hypothetical protein